MQTRSRATVDALVEAAAQVFETHGYAAGTTNRIAERAGVSIGTLYQYFADKDALLVAVAERHLADGVARLAALVTRLDDDPAPEEAIGAFVRAMAELHADRPALHAFLFERAPLPEAVREEVRDLERRLTAPVAAWLRRRPTPPPDPETTAWALVQAVEALTHRWVLDPPPDADRTAFERTLTRLLAAAL